MVTCRVMSVSPQLLAWLPASPSCRRARNSPSAKSAFWAYREPLVLGNSLCFQRGAHSCLALCPWCERQVSCFHARAHSLRKKVGGGGNLCSKIASRHSHSRVVPFGSDHFLEDRRKTSRDAPFRIVRFQFTQIRDVADVVALARLLANRSGQSCAPVISSTSAIASSTETLFSRPPPRL